MKNLWIELGYYQNFKMKCSEDAAIMLKFVERERVYEFLAGLNIEYDQVHVQIFGKDHLPTLSEVFSTVRTEEGRRGIMLETPLSDSSALITGFPTAAVAFPRSPQQNTNRPNHSRSYNRSTNNNDELFCHCGKKSGHTKDICWKLSGKPPRNYTPGKFLPRNYQANIVRTEEKDASTTQEVSIFQQEEIEKLQSFLAALDKPVGSCSMAQSGSNHGEDDWAC